MNIYCPGCKTTLPKTSFFANAGRINGASVNCKTCYAEYNSSPDRRAKRTWNTINARAGKQAGYEHVRVLMTRDEYLSFALPAYREWMAKHPGQTPSLDRIDSDGHYELKNIRIIERSENCRLQKKHKNVYAPDGQAWCIVCKEYLDRGYFWKCSTRFNGLQTRCKPCQMKAIKKSQSSLDASNR